MGRVTALEHQEAMNILLRMPEGWDVSFSRWPYGIEEAKAVVNEVKNINTKRKELLRTIRQMKSGRRKRR